MVAAILDGRYAETWAKRTGQAGLWRGERRRTSAANWRLPLRWNRETPGARVFCASLADVFEDRAELVPWRDDLWALIAATPRLTWLLLTKRPEVAARLYPGRIASHPNIWVGTTVEDQAAADERIPHLLRIPAAARFLSCEPLLGPVELSNATRRADSAAVLGRPALAGIHWVIGGTESGPRRRPADLAWLRNLRDQCAAAGVPFFLKQAEFGGRVVHAPELDGRQWLEFPCAP